MSTSDSSSSKIIREIVHGYQAKTASHPDKFARLMLPNYTTKASLVYHAYDKKKIVHKAYVDHVFSIPVERVTWPDRHSHFTPLLMYIEEGSLADFTQELAQLYGEEPERPVDLTVVFRDPDRKADEYRDAEKDTRPVPGAVWANGNVARIQVRYEDYYTPSKTK